MLKTKRNRAFFVVVVIFSMISIYGFIPIVTAASLTDAKDTLSDSDVSASGVTHTLSYTLGVALVATDKIVITFPAGFGNILVGNVTCPANTTAGVNLQVVTCTATGPVSGQATTTITTMTNPGTADDYTINITTKTTADVEIETVDVMVYILDDVTMDANVPANLTFSVAGLNFGTDVNGAITTATSTATTTPFGTLSTTASSSVGQQLQVSTNADDGYTVTVQQTSNLQTAGSADIDAFDDGTVGAAKPWEAPTPNVADENTWGHMGLTSEDDSLPGDTFGNQLYTGFNGTNPVAVMYHNGPVNGTGDGIGITQVAYTVQISAMQEAGDYSTVLTYICTPQF